MSITVVGVLLGSSEEGSIDDFEEGSNNDSKEGCLMVLKNAELAPLNQLCSL